MQGSGLGPEQVVQLGREGALFVRRQQFVVFQHGVEPAVEVSDFGGGGVIADMLSQVGEGLHQIFQSVSRIRLQLTV